MFDVPGFSSAIPTGINIPVKSSHGFRRTVTRAILLHRLCWGLAVIAALAARLHNRKIER